MKPGDSLLAIIISLICFALTGFCLGKMLVLLDIIKNSKGDG